MIGRPLSLTLVLSTLAIALLIAGESSHKPVACGISFRGPNRQLDLQGFSDLPAAVQEIVVQHIRDRVGSRYSSDLFFIRGQLKNLDAATPSDELKDPSAGRLYNLLYRFQLSPEQKFLACILVEPNGTIVQALSLPAWAHGAAPPEVVTSSEAKAIATKHGWSAEAELSYFPDTDTLEWLFTKKTDEDGALMSGKTLHVPVQDSASIHWSKWEAIR